MWAFTGGLLIRTSGYLIFLAELEKGPESKRFLASLAPQGLALARGSRGLLGREELRRAPEGGGREA